jgi:hypothetical protein
MPFPCAARLGKTQQRKVKVKVKATQKNESKKSLPELCSGRLLAAAQGFEPWE